jgi:hypothetical protein
MMEENNWSTCATNGGSSPPSVASSSEIDLTEQGQEQISSHLDPKTSLSPALAQYSSALLLDNTAITGQNNYSMEVFNAYKEEQYLDIDAALEPDFMSASLERMKDFIQNVETILEQN